MSNNEGGLWKWNIRLVAYDGSELYVESGADGQTHVATAKLHRFGLEQSPSVETGDTVVFRSEQFQQGFSCMIDFVDFADKTVYGSQIFQEIGLFLRCLYCLRIEEGYSCEDSDPQCDYWMKRIEQLSF
ncbi:hypothetical protein QPK87_28295 [Kamptonema cortianum]|nr:hypothetical protein [Geitlerinema splendidum]MDK3160428.1 hypothetical protein [Kamptonema cortianum]